MKQWTVAPAEAGQRLDMVLVARSKASRQQVKRWLDSGVVRLNGRTVVIAKWVVHSGERLTIEERMATEASRERRASRRLVEVLYEDAALIAIDKPSGMIVVPEEKTSAPTVVDAVRAYLKRKYPTARGTYARALHRLDRGTTGVVLVAKSKDGERVIQQFKRHAVLREYVAIVHGAIAKGSGTLRQPLAKGRFARGRKVMAVGHHPEARPKDPAFPEGKSAITHFDVEERYTNATLLNIRVETGRTHQIRVHLAAMGHPLIGDALYGFPRGAKHEARSTKHEFLPSGRQALHATRLKFHHPLSGDVIDVHAPLPQDLKRLIDQLRSM